ncbi:hypothetical protein PIB30_011432 [Stylosanthes scabra]|uniref:Uncharacterized protein n=1 Tax=Stylosanthes scabra TaxID=79078 RepID=A0ABU6Q6T6_9FABA|nr:hypothetical protein [Stylosanthes scabra]
MATCDGIGGEIVNAKRLSPLGCGNSGTGSGIPRSGPCHCLRGILPLILVPTGKIPRLRFPIRPSRDPRSVENFDTPRFIPILF